MAPTRSEINAPRLPWWKKLLFGTFIAGALLALLELGLAACGVRPLAARRDPFVGFSGAAPHFEERGELGREPRMRTAFHKLGYLNDQSFAVRKPASTFRIFCLGGSTTFGRPYNDATSYSGWLRALLETAAPEQDWEVVNAGGVSYAGYRVTALMEELAAYQPDLFIIYTGHNEFLEARTYPELWHAAPASQWLTTAAMRLRTASVMDDLWQSTRKRSDVFELPDEVDTILDHTVGLAAYERDDAQHRDIGVHFEISLERMVDLARGSGAAVVFVRPACNLKDCSPFKSQLSDSLNEARRQAWRQAFDRGEQRHQAGRHREAVTAFAAAVAIDDRHAMLHYRLGQSLFALGKFAEAEAALRRAVDEDVCPLRMTSELDQALRRVVARRGVPLVDVQELLARDCLAAYGHTVLGREYFLDHVHPTIATHGQLAVALAERLSEERILPGPLRWTAAELAKVNNLIYDNIDTRLRARAEANLARVLYWAGKVEEAGPLALNCHETEDDPRILLIAGIHLHRQGETRQALDLLRRAQRMSPTDARIEQALEAIEHDALFTDT